MPTRLVSLASLVLPGSRTAILEKLESVTFRCVLRHSVCGLGTIGTGLLVALWQVTLLIASFVGIRFLVVAHRLEEGIVVPLWVTLVSVRCSVRPLKIEFLVSPNSRV